MPPRERIPNTALSSRELRAIMEADITRLLDNLGELGTTAAYGRVSYSIKIALHMANIYHPYAEITLDSRPPADDVLLRSPALAALEAPPLSPAPDPSPATSGVAADELTRTIDSPNAERLRLGLPVPVHVRQPDGSEVTERVLYPKPDPNSPEATGTVAIKDVTAEQRIAWHLADLAAAAAADEEESST